MGIISTRSILKWIRPVPAEVKLNTDRCTKGCPGAEEWNHWGIYKPFVSDGYGHCSNNVVELGALHTAL